MYKINFGLKKVYQKRQNLYNVMLFYYISDYGTVKNIVHLRQYRSNSKFCAFDLYTLMNSIETAKFFVTREPSRLCQLGYNATPPVSSGTIYFTLTSVPR